MKPAPLFSAAAWILLAACGGDPYAKAFTVSNQMDGGSIRAKIDVLKSPALLPLPPLPPGAAEPQFTGWLATERGMARLVFKRRAGGDDEVVALPGAPAAFSQSVGPGGVVLESRSASAENVTLQGEWKTAGEN